LDCIKYSLSQALLVDVIALRGVNFDFFNPAKPVVIVLEYATRRVTK
jgi:hypothetical protein